MSPAEGDLDASIVICTRNRASALQLTLSALASLDTAGATYEIIVADNGSTDHTGEILRDFASVLPLRVVQVASSGASNARNAAFAIARGNIFLVTDDDCVVAANWLLIANRLLTADTRQVIAGWVGLHNPEDLPLTIKLELGVETLTNAGQLFGFAHGCNLIFGRCVVEEIGGYDARLGPGTKNVSEDTDFIYRAFLVGIPVIYQPELKVTHNHGRRDATAARHLRRSYDRGIGALAVKDGLNGRVTIAKAVYWRISAPWHDQRAQSLASYLAGGLSYLWSRVRADPRHKVMEMSFD